MIVLDTNVVSEALRLRPSPAVIAWLDRQMAETLFLTTISLAELLCGVERLAPGRRRRGLASEMTEVIATLFGPRLLPFDKASAHAYATLAARAEAAGRPIGFADGQIAAIATTNGFTVASRDGAPFRAAGLEVIDPWPADQP